MILFGALPMLLDFFRDEFGNVGLQVVEAEVYCDYSER
jgi:hypothetical protein